MVCVLSAYALGCGLSQVVTIPTMMDDGGGAEL